MAEREFADELVILAMTLEFNVRIVCVPYTHPGAARPWAISTYAAPTTPPGNEIVLGNNDVHFMWITSTFPGEPPVVQDAVMQDTPAGSSSALSSDA